jgi:hypothetical protein
MRRGKRVVFVAGVPVFGLLVPTDSGFRLRAQSAEWETLGVEAGQTVSVSPAGSPERTYLIAWAETAPGGRTWVHFAAPIGVNSTAGPLATA